VQRTAEKWNLKRDIQFNTAVIALDWLEDQGKWKVRVRKEGQEERDEIVDILVSAQGFLRSVAVVVQSARFGFPSLRGLIGV